MMALFLCFFAFTAMLLMTYRDLRIFHRTGYLSYRKGAFQSLIASVFCMIGCIVLVSTNLSGTFIALLFVFIGTLINKKGKREQVFTTAGTFARLTGKTDIVRDVRKKDDF